MALENAESKRAHTESTDMIGSLKELLQTQHQQLEQAVREQLSAHKEEIQVEIGGVKDQVKTLEDRVSKLEVTPTQPQAQPEPPADGFVPCQVAVGGWPEYA